jgi:hypothetical protein
VDRLVDEGHAALVGQTARVLKASGWDARPEVSYSSYGERGSYDLLAWHSQSSSLLVVEVKTELVSVEATLRKLDEKARLAAGVARDRLGWVSTGVSRILVLPRGSTTYRQVVRHRAVIDLVLPNRSRSARSWLLRPTGRIGAVVFVSVTNDSRRRSSRRGRVRRASERDGSAKRAIEAPSEPSGGCARAPRPTRRVIVHDANSAADHGRPGV